MALKRTRFTFATDDAEQTVTVTQADRIKMNRMLEDEGLDFSRLSVSEYETRLAFIAGTRIGLITEPDFMAWAATIEALEDAPDTAVSPGEAGATLAS
jgi:hypothetical protein